MKNRAEAPIFHTAVCAGPKQPLSQPGNCIRSFPARASHKEPGMESNMRVTEDLRYGEGEAELYDLFCPDGEGTDVLIWFHGGGLEAGDRKNPPFAEDLTKKGIIVASAEYRLYPEAKFPDFVWDCAKAVRCILDRFRGSGKRVFVSGQSAGAYITLLLAFDERYFEAAGVDKREISGYISDSAQITVHYNVLRERGMDTRLERIDEAAPIYFMSPESDFGRLYLICYEDDMPCRPEQNVLFYKGLLRTCPDQEVRFARLPGPHCHGSSERSESGRFDFNDKVLEFLSLDGDR